VGRGGWRGAAAALVRAPPMRWWSPPLLLLPEVRAVGCFCFVLFGVCCGDELVSAERRDTRRETESYGGPGGPKLIRKFLDRTLARCDGARARACGNARVERAPLAHSRAGETNSRMHNASNQRGKAANRG